MVIPISRSCRDGATLVKTEISRTDLKRKWSNRRTFGDVTLPVARVSGEETDKRHDKRRDDNDKGTREKRDS